MHLLKSSKAKQFIASIELITILGMLILLAVVYVIARKEPVMDPLPSSAVYLFTATDTEQSVLRKKLKIYSSASLPEGATIGFDGNRAFVLVLTGVGPKRAATRASFLTDSSILRQLPRPTAVVILGVCGGLVPALVENDTVLYSNCRTIDAKDPEILCSAELTARISAALGANNISFKPVSGITSPRVAINRQEKALLAKSGAHVVDMESYAVLEAATKAGIPVAIVRVVSDSLDRDLPDFNQALRPDGSIAPLAVARLAIAPPVAFTNAYLASRKATSRLAEVSSAILNIDLSK